MARMEQGYSVSTEPLRSIQTSRRLQPGTTVTVLLGALLVVGTFMISAVMAVGATTPRGAGSALVAEPSPPTSPDASPTDWLSASPDASPLASEAPSPAVSDPAGTTGPDVTPSPGATAPDVTPDVTSAPTPDVTPEPTAPPTPEPTPYPSPAFAIACTVMGPLETYCNGTGSDHAVTFAWEAAGQTGTAPDISLTFPQPGTYTVNLTVGNGLGDYSSGSTTVDVYAATPAPTAS